MKLKDVIVKNFKANFRNYISCFLYNSFCIMSYFMFTTLFYNRDIDRVKEYSDAMRDSLTIAIYVIAVFSVIFIAYSQNAFIKSRSREFGLYSLFGMTKYEIQKFILVENSIIQCVSLMIGLTFGTVFSPVFFIVIIRFLDLRNVSFHFPLKSYILTISVFITIFSIINIITIMLLSKFEIIKMLKMNRGRETNPVSHSAFGILGFVLLGAAAWVWSLAPSGPESFKYLMGSFVMFLVSSYFILSQTGSIVILLSRFSKKMYYKNLLNFAEVNHRVNSLKKIMFLISMLIAISTLFLIITLTEMMGMNESVEDRYKFHLYYSEFNGKNNIPKSEIEDITEKSNNKVEIYRELPYIVMGINIRNVSSHAMVTSEGEYNSALGGNIKVSKGEAYRTISGNGATDLDGADLMFNFLIADKSIGQIADDNSKSDDKKYRVKVLRDNSGLYCYILNDDDYNEMKKTADPAMFGKEHLVCFKDWMKSEDAVTNILQRLEEYNESIPGSNDLINDNSIRAIIKPAAKINYYLSQRNKYSTIILVFVFIGVFFFFMACNILYLKYFNAKEEIKEMFVKLFRIGIKDYEIKSMVSKELRFIFFIPLLLGFAVGFIYNFSMALKKMSMMESCLKASAYVSVTYLVLNVIHYFYTRQKILKYIYSSLGFTEV